MFLKINDRPNAAMINVILDADRRLNTRNSIQSTNKTVTLVRTIEKAIDTNNGHPKETGPIEPIPTPINTINAIDIYAPIARISPCAKLANRNTL